MTAWPPLVMVVSSVTVMVRVHPSSVLSDSFEPSMAVIVMPPKPRPKPPPNAPKPFRSPLFESGFAGSTRWTPAGSVACGAAAGAWLAGAALDGSETEGAALAGVSLAAAELAALADGSGDAAMTATTGTIRATMASVTMPALIGPRLRTRFSTSVTWSRSCGAVCSLL